MLAENLNKKKEKILELETRRKIYYLVKKQSGCHFREIERISGIQYGTLKYHLNFLTRHGLIISKKDNNNLRYFPSDFRPENIKPLSLLRQKALRKIILFLMMNESANHEEIARFIHLSPSTVSWHLNKLIKEGIITSEKSGRKNKYKISIDKEEIVKLLIVYKESFFDSLVSKVVEMWEVK